MFLHDRHLYSANRKIVPALVLAQPGDNVTVSFLNTSEEETSITFEDLAIEQNA